jgi:hypothetical protein
MASHTGWRQRRERGNPARSIAASTLAQLVMAAFQPTCAVRTEIVCRKTSIAGLII